MNESSQKCPYTRGNWNQQAHRPFLIWGHHKQGPITAQPKTQIVGHCWEYQAKIQLLP